MYSSGLFVSAVSGGCSLSVSEQPAAKVSTARANSPRAHLENLPRRSITTEPIRKQHKIQFPAAQQRPRTTVTGPALTQHYCAASHFTYSSMLAAYSSRESKSP